MKLNLTLALFVFALCPVAAQDKSLPYYEIPAYPEHYSASSVAARMIDGLGFRYYWATEALRPEDLRHQPSKEARTSLETIAHIYGLSRIIVNATMKVPTVFGKQEPTLSFADMRKKTLENFKVASDRLKAIEGDELNKLNMVFQRDTTKTIFPFWNEINGPIADALWHVGQVVSFRRTSGNPYNSNANVLTGKVQPGTKGDN